MGASLYAAYPAWLLLAQSGQPAFWIDASELLHYMPGMITPRTLLAVFSQSGRSAEIVGVLERTHHERPAALLAFTNDSQSLLAQEATQVVPLHAAPEQTVSTRTYLNTLAFGQLAARALLGGAIETDLWDLNKAADAMEVYLSGWKSHLKHTAQVMGDGRSAGGTGALKHLAILGRGASLASAYCGALIVGEAAKHPALALPAAEFRHGPMEMASPELTVLILAGPPETKALNRRLLGDLRLFGARSLWIGAEPEADLPMPEGNGIALPLAETPPLQMLSVWLCQAKGIQPGDFFFSGKVTLEE
jgi:glucosamine--fructose-6-phosphate aminotransferase (isomerizing)